MQAQEALTAALLQGGHFILRFLKKGVDKQKMDVVYLSHEERNISHQGGFTMVNKLGFFGFLGVLGFLGWHTGQAGYYGFSGFSSISAISSLCPMRCFAKPSAAPPAGAFSPL